MERHELIETLKELHSELSRADHVDPETLDLLHKLTGDIGRLFDRKDYATIEYDAGGVTGGLKDLLLKFEAEHPQLSATVGKVADALAAIGI